jgi:hypothetical protein
MKRTNVRLGGKKLMSRSGGLIESSLVSIKIVSTQPVAKAACSKQRVNTPHLPRHKKAAIHRRYVRKRSCVARFPDVSLFFASPMNRNLRWRSSRRTSGRDPSGREFKGKRSHIPERIATVSSTTTRESCFVSLALGVCTIFPELLDRGEEFVQHALPCYRLLNVVT